MKMSTIQLSKRFVKYNRSVYAELSAVVMVFGITETHRWPLTPTPICRGRKTTKTSAFPTCPVIVARRQTPKGIFTWTKTTKRLNALFYALSGDVRLFVMSKRKFYPHIHEQKHTQVKASLTFTFWWQMIIKS